MGNFKDYMSYSAVSYKDAALSVRVGLAYTVNAVWDSLNNLYPNDFRQSSWEKNKKYIPAYLKREKLRSEYDSKPGALYLQSNLAGLVTSAGVAMGAAELSNFVLDAVMPAQNALLKNFLVSDFTLLSEFAADYFGFMYTEVKTNKHKYIDKHGNLSSKKIGAGLWSFIKVSSPFDTAYVGIKITEQTYFMSTGQDPWAASAIADASITPLWAIFTIPLGLNENLIDTKFCSKKKRSEKKPYNGITSDDIHHRTSSRKSYHFPRSFLDGVNVSPENDSHYYSTTRQHNHNTDGNFADLADKRYYSKNRSHHHRSK